jgi:acyl dehydratase
MEINSRFVGACLKPTKRQITWRQTTNYAAAVGDLNPRYLDDERTEGLVAPPMFPVAVTWPISEQIQDYLSVEDFPYQVLLTQVHYTEHIRLYRLLRPGDNLLIKGKIAAMVPHKSGTVMVLRYDAYDQTEETVFTEHIGGLMRGVRCRDGGAGVETLPEMSSLETKEAPVWETAVAVSLEAPFIYDGCTNIVFPIHTSVAFAHQVGLPGIIYQGTAILALGVREIINREIGGDPERVNAIAGRFTGMVIPGSSIHVQMRGRKTQRGQTDIFFEILNAEGKRAVSNGVVSVSV